MSITDITNKIIADASKKAEGMIKNAELKVSEISSATEVMKEKIQKENRDETQKALRENERRIVSAAEQEVKLKIDNEKRVAVDTVFKNAIKQLTSLPSKEYEKIISDLLKKVPENTTGKIIAPTQRKNETENAIKNNGMTYEIETTSKFEGGFIFSGENFEINFTFEEMMRSKKSYLEVDVAKILFT